MDEVDNDLDQFIAGWAQAVDHPGEMVDKTAAYAELSSKPLKDLKGQVNYCQTAITDITQFQINRRNLLALTVLIGRDSRVQRKRAAHPY